MTCSKRAGAFALLLTFAFVSTSRSSEDDYANFDLSELLRMDVVYGASTYEQVVSEAPSAVTVVTGDEIREYGYTTLGEVLDAAAGFYTSEDRNYGYVGIRGFSRPGDYNSRLLILLDGHELNDNLYLAGTTDTSFPIDLDLVQRVEIIRGPSSALYGSSAFFGVVNIITMSGEALEGAELAASVQSHEGYTGRLSWGGVTDAGHRFLVSASGYDAAGEDIYYAEFDDPSTNDGVFSGGDADRNRRFLGRFDAGGLQLTGAFVSRRKEVPTAAYDTIFNDSGTWTRDDRGWVDARWTGELGGAGELTLTAFYDYIGYDGRYQYDYAEEGEDPWLVTNRDQSEGRWIGTKARWTGELGKRNRIVAGSDVRWSLRRFQGVHDIDPYALYLNSDEPSYDAGFYAQDEIRIHESALLSVGVRHDRYENFQSTNPRFALVVEPRAGTTLKALYGTAFRAPNAYEVYYGDGDWQLQNPDLLPEEMKSGELIWEQKLGGRLGASASWFHYQIDHLITQVTDAETELLVFRNVERIASDGVELALDARLLPGVRGRASYSYQDTRDDATGLPLTNSPNHLAKANVLMPYAAWRTDLGVELLYVSDRKTLSGGTAEEHILTNLTLGHRLPGGRGRVSLSAYNVFDVDYGDPGSGEHVQDVIPRWGRTYRTKLTMAW